MKTSRPGLFAIVAPAFLAAWVVWRATAPGVTFSPDGVSYLEAARSFAAGSRLWLPVDCGASREWLTHFAPLYPVLIGSGMKAGADPFTWARVLSIVCAALTAAIAAAGTLRLSGSAAAAALAGCALALLPDLIAIDRAMLSEPLYLLLVMIGWLGLSGGIANKSNRSTRWAALALGLATATRYAALPLLPVAAGFVWWKERRLRLALEFLAIAAAPSAAVAAVGLLASGSVPPRPFALHPPPLRELAGLVKIVAGWLGITHGSGTLDAVVLAFLVAGLLALMFRHQTAATVARRQGATTGAGLAICLLAAHWAGLLAARTFFDASIELGSQRMLILLFPLGLMVLSAALPRRLLILTLVFLGLVHLNAGLLQPRPVPLEYNSNSPDWLASQTLARIGDLGPGVCTYSNAPDVVYRRYGKPTQWLPEATSWFTGQPEPWCETAKRDLVRHPLSAYVYFDVRRSPSPAVQEAELTNCLAHLSRVPLRDGTILLPEQGP